MLEIKCKCGKVALQLMAGSKTRDGYVIYCSRKCAGLDKPAMEIPSFMADLLGGKFKGGR